MNHPEFPKDIQLLINFLLNIINNKCIYLSRHIFILKNIDTIHRNNPQAFRVILERFSDNVLFIATTNKINMLEAPIISRMVKFRIPVPSEIEQKAVLHKLTNKTTIRYIDRNFVKNIFFNEQDTTANNYSELIYPPLHEFIIEQKNKYDKNEIRNLSFKMYQQCITIPIIVRDLLKFIPDTNNKIDFIESVTKIEYIACQSDETKICFFIEYILHLFYVYR
jgi:hypothetical protein